MIDTEQQLGRIQDLRQTAHSEGYTVDLNDIRSIVAKGPEVAKAEMEKLLKPRTSTEDLIKISYYLELQDDISSELAALLKRNIIRLIIASNIMSPDEEASKQHAFALRLITILYQRLPEEEQENFRATMVAFAKARSTDRMARLRITEQLIDLYVPAMEVAAIRQAIDADLDERKTTTRIETDHIFPEFDE